MQALPDKFRERKKLIPAYITVFARNDGELIKIAFKCKLAVSYNTAMATTEEPSSETKSAFDSASYLKNVTSKPGVYRMLDRSEERRVGKEC